MEPIQTQEAPMRYGQRLVSWFIDEHPRHIRSRVWYVAASVIGAALIIYAVATANFLFAVIILMFGIITLISSFKEPERVEVAITTNGVVIDDAFYGYKDIRDFSLVYNPPETKLLYLDFASPWQPILAVPLAEVDPNLVRTFLLPYCLENLDRTEETLTDTIRRVYKL